jgi:cell envelope-related function transcriptional attenuator common domain
MIKLIGLLASLALCFFGFKIAYQFYIYEVFEFNLKLTIIIIFTCILLLVMCSLLKVVFKPIKRVQKKAQQRKIKKISLRKKRTANVTLILLNIILFFANSFYTRTNKLINAITFNDNEPDEITAYLYTFKDNGIESIHDLNIIHIGYLESDRQNLYTLITRELEEKYNRIKFLDYQSHFYEQETSFYNDLENDTLQAIIISEDSKKNLETNFGSINNNLVLLEKITIKTGIASKPVDLTSESFNILIMGVDIRPSEGDIHTKTRSDTLMLATFNPQTMSLNLTSIPRDSYVPITCDNNKRDKITHVGYYGTSCTIETIEELLDLDINYYTKFNFTALVNLVDTLGGVKVDVKYDFTEQDSNDNANSITIKEGLQTLNGEEALAYSRHRKTVNDHQRSEAQQLVLNAIIKELTGFSVVTKFDSLTKVMQNNMLTNLTRKELYDLATIAPNMGQLTVTSNVIDGSDELYYVPKYDQDLYVTFLDEESIELIRENIKLIMGTEELHRTSND